MEKLNELIKLCKADVSIEINSHKSSYESVEQYFNENPFNKEYLDDGEIESEVYEKMKELDTIVELQFYPDTPIGFCKVWHYDAESAIDIALNYFEEK